MNVLRTIHRDFKRQGSTLKDPGLWALACYRLGVESAALAPGPWRWMATRLARGLAFSVAALTRTSIAPDVKVGEALHLIHGTNVSLAAGVELGDGVGIMHEVTIGPSSDRAGLPRIGNGVFIGVGATILGPVTIGDGAMISANSLVVSDVPAGGVAIGVPARVVLWNAPARAATGSSPAVTPADGDLRAS
jgi:serine O-acetyltransferase